MSDLKQKFDTWWRELADPSHNGLNRKRADMAHLRRISLIEDGDGGEPDVVAAMGIDAFRDLHKLIKPSPKDEADLVTCAYVLAHIRDRSSLHPAAALGHGDPPRMNPTAFLSLMRAETTGDLFEQARRMAALLKGEADAAELATSLYLWRRKPEIRREWARRYYGLDRHGHELASAPAQA
ncbi:type I-E CRISPR-associated protein Cse2/CasB [Asticcacaulis sp. AC402]|uniref:type I-E CRISPR-associated protein Cse2/CasB n=1 Tax=Asticcacaulis sp. AC402 TaxID=1282361 RepID=UPI0003C3DC56|nr:type I-E CRISPR-associated protein Cse2/CasB [Asticcacaulis sp. AC402]ESQ74769.1 hypothetical protein ABAC402_12755 [Asticcacaulis sp. AC402]